MSKKNRKRELNTPNASNDNKKRRISTLKLTNNTISGYFTPIKSRTFNLLTPNKLNKFNKNTPLKHRTDSREHSFMMKKVNEYSKIDNGYGEGFGNDKLSYSLTKYSLERWVNGDKLARKFALKGFSERWHGMFTFMYFNPKTLKGLCGECHKHYKEELLSKKPSKLAYNNRFWCHGFSMISKNLKDGSGMKQLSSWKYHIKGREHLNAIGECVTQEVCCMLFIPFKCFNEYVYLL